MPHSLSIQSNAAGGKSGCCHRGGTGIGKAISKALAAQGARVAVASRNSSHLETMAKEFRGLNIPLLTIQMDVRRKEDVHEAVAKVAGAWGSINILVNNAGISGLSRIDSPDDSRWYDILDTNLTGTYLMTKEVLKVMNDRSDGRIINVSSVLGKFGVPGYTAYCASKHGMIGFTKALALEVADRGITVNTICPGWVDTEMARLGIDESAAEQRITLEEFKKNAIAAIPVRRFLEAEEIARLVVYLVSDKARGITGQAINICGGQTMV